MKESQRQDYWLLWAVHDYESAGVLAADQRHNWACYLAAQAADKALKALLLALGSRPPYTHALVRLLHGLQEAGVPAEKLAPLHAHARFLTRAEQSARYPQDDLLPEDLFDADDARTALAHARACLDFVVTELGADAVAARLAGAAARPAAGGAARPAED